MSESNEIKFIGWQRSRMYDLTGDGPLNQGRLAGSVPLVLRARDSEDSRTGAADFLIMGPRDVRGIKPNVIAAVSPANHAQGVETTRCPYVTFTRPDLPWRYTPVRNPTEIDANVNQLKPWIALLVGSAGEEITPETDGSISVRSELLLLYSLDKSWQWAHVQASGDRLVSRLLSARGMDPNTEYIAAIVPTFDVNGEPRWDASGMTTDGTNNLPCYHQWRFWTGKSGDFKTLAAKLTLQSSDQIGAATIRYHVESASETFSLPTPGALTGVGQTQTLDDSQPDEVVVSHLHNKVDSPERDDMGRPIIGMPHYGDQWFEPPEDLPWGEEANFDPRQRGIAGLGAWLALEKQEELAQAAADQIGALNTAAQRLRHLGFGLAAATSLWNHRLPDDAASRLLLFGPSLRRIMAKSGSVQDEITGATRPLASGLFSSAARRVFRHGTARARLAQPDAFLPKNLLAVANKPPSAPQPDEPGLPADAYGEFGRLVEALHNDTWLDEQVMQELVSRLVVDLEDIAGWLPHGENSKRDEVPLLCLVQQLNFSDDLAIVSDCEPDGADLFEFFRKVLEKPDVPEVQPIAIEALAGALSEAIAPLVPQWVPYQRVVAGIQGITGDPLAPQEICIGLNLPLWRDLRDLAPDWLLPGIGQIKEDSIVALEANPKFIDALLVGVNSQLVSELRWRNIPIATGCTPIKMFWDQVDLRGTTADDVACDAEAPPPGRKHDIKGIITWAGTTPANKLGGETHRPDTNDVSRRLVVVFRSNLFRRYPQTVVSLVSAIADPTSERADWDQNPSSDAAQLLPVIQGAIGEDIVFFGFDVEASHADRYWLMLEEPPPGFGFRNTADTCSWSDDRVDQFFGNKPEFQDGASFADAACNDPSRVLISGSALLE